MRWSERSNRLGSWIRALTLLAGISAASTAGGQDAKLGDPFVALNAVFRQNHARAREKLLLAGGPIILLDSDEIILIEGEKRQTAAYLPALYHWLKTVAHTPMAAFCLLAPEANGPASDPVVAEAARIVERIAAATPTLDDRGFSPAQLPRQREILAKTRTFLETLARQRRVDVAARDGFLRDVKPLILSNMNDAARLQIDALHEKVTAWKRNLSADEWSRLKVVVIGGQMPRKDNVAVQYFARRLGVAGEGERIVYAEGLFEQPRALSLMGTHLVDRRIAIGLFGDPWRMERELLANSAGQYLDSLTFD